MDQRVCVGVFDTLIAAELAKSALLDGGIEALIQGGQAGGVANVIATRYPLWVDEADADVARAVLSTLEQLELSSEVEGPLDVIQGEMTSADPKWISGPIEERLFRRVSRRVLGFFLYSFLGLLAIVATMVVAVSVADALHPTPFEHFVAVPINPFVLAALVGLSLSISEGARRHALLLYLVVAFLLIASVRPRSAPPIHPDVPAHPRALP